MEYNLTTNQMLFLGACFERSSVPEMLQRIKEETGISISKAGAYTTVDRLEKAGLVETELKDLKNPSGKMVKRRFVQITGEGQRAMAHAGIVLNKLRVV